jgi:hypothetical protein
MNRNHFAGLNTAPIAQALEGRDVLVSYADVVRRPGVWSREILPRLEAGAYGSVILDSGAFTELGDPTFHVDLEDYATFALDHADLFDVVVNLDDIRGDLARSQANQARLEELGVPAIPVFHQGEPWSELERLVETYDYIGVGFQRPIRGARGFLGEFFSRVAGRCRVHGFGMTRWAPEFPFATTDSTTWIAEFRAIRVDLALRPGPHGLRGPSASWAAQAPSSSLYSLVLESYAGPVAWAPRARLEDTAGQARTVLTRAAAVELELVAA